jgi:Glutaredoxin-like domain (DUF836)
MAKLILYSKPGCHLCEGLQEKLEQIHTLDFELEIRDITSRDDWFQAYQYEIPVMVLQKDKGERREEKDKGERINNKTGEAQLSIDTGGETDTLQPLAFSLQPSFTPLPRLSPRATVQQVEQMLQKHGVENRSK